MAPRHPLRSGTLTFGLVSIPIQVVPAVRSRRSHFMLLHKEDNAPLGRRMYCPKHKTYVHPEHIVRGYEYEPDKFVVVLDSEIDAIEPDHTQSIEIENFVPAEKIDPLYCRRPYYLVPDGADKPYRLLVEVLREAGMAGIARFVMHDREYLTAVMSIDGALCLMTLYYREELLEANDLAGHGKTKKQFVQALRKAMRGLEGDFEPDKLRDVYQERVDELIEQKKKAHKLVEVAVSDEQQREAGEEETEGVDLIEALEASLAKTRGGKR